MRVMIVKLAPYGTRYEKYGDGFALGEHCFDALPGCPEHNLQIRSICNGTIQLNKNRADEKQSVLHCNMCETKIPVLEPIENILTYWAYMTIQLQCRIKGIISTGSGFFIPYGASYLYEEKRHDCSCVWYNWKETGIALAALPEFSLAWPELIPRDWFEQATLDVLVSLAHIHGNSIKQASQTAHSAFGWLYQKDFRKAVGETSTS